MQKSVLFTTSFFFFLLIIGIHDASAETLSLKQQLADNVATSEIKCKEYRVLTERPNGKLACVYLSTAEKLDWNVIDGDTSTDTYSIFELVFNDNTYEIEYEIEGGILENMTKNPEYGSLTIQIDAFEDGKIKMQFTDELILVRDHDFVYDIRADGKLTYSYISSGEYPNSAWFEIYFKEGNTVIDIRIVDTIPK